MKGIICYFLVVLQFLLGCGNSVAQDFPQLHFKHLGKKEGLSNNYVNYISQDKNGFIWFGTVSGLNRYDGYRFKTFYHNEGDTTSLPNSYITKITPANGNNVWISTQNGLALFNLNTYKCRYVVHENINPSSKITNFNPEPYTDEKGQTYVSTDFGLYKLNPDFSTSKIPQGLKPFYSSGMLRKYHRHWFNDKLGNIWAFIADRIFLLDTETKKVKKTFVAPGNKTITYLYFQNDSICWISTWGNGIVKFNTQTGQFKNVDLGKQKHLISHDITPWTINNKTYLVICTSGYGIYLIDPVTMDYKRYLNDETDGKTISKNNVHYAFVDKQNTLWLATENGVKYVTPSSGFFDIIPIGTSNKDTKVRYYNDRVVRNFYETDSTFWVGKWNYTGNYLYNKNWQLLKYVPTFNSITSKNIVYGTYSTMPWKDDLYFTTDSGLVAMNKTTYKTRMFKPPGIIFPNLRNIIKYNDSIWWVRSFRNGIFIFDVSKQMFVGHLNNKNKYNYSLPENGYRGLHKDKKGLIWVLTSTGLLEYMSDTDKFKAYYRNEKDNITFPDNCLTSIDEDSNGNLWIGSIAGICRFNPDTKKVEQIFDSNKYIGMVLNICVDNYENVWFKSFTGIWCWLREQDKLLQFSTNDGLPEGDTYCAMEKAQDGNIYIGAVHSLVKFYPQKIMRYKQAFTTRITDVSIDNKQVTIDDTKQKKLSLNPNQKVFTVDFAVLNYDRAGKNKYFYRLLPNATEWIENNTGHLSFFNLAPGTYQLEVKGETELGHSGFSADTLLVMVNPHWYQTKIFKLLIILLIGLFIYFYVQKRMQAVKKDAAFQRKIAETEMKALRAQMNPHFIFNSLNSIENFILLNDKRNASDYLNKFSQLIRNILNSSRNEIVPLAKDMDALLLYVELEQLRFNNNFTYQTYVEPQLLQGDYRVPSLLVQPYVENAIIHGLANSNNDNLQLTVTVVLENNIIKYTIQDNGIGRKKAEEYKLQNKTKHKSIGLKISEDRIRHFNRPVRIDDAIIITDLSDSKNRPAGTKVEIKLKEI